MSIRPFLISFAVIALAALAVLGYGAYRAEERVAADVALRIGVFQSALEDVNAERFAEAREKLVAGAEGLPPQVGVGEIRSFDDGVRVLGALFGGASGAYRDFSELQKTLASLLGRIEFFSQALPKSLIGAEGPSLADAAAEIRDSLHALSERSERLMRYASAAGSFTPIDPSEYVALRVEMERAARFFDAFAPYLAEDTDRRFAVLLGNTAELRPGGGFTGSYAEVVFRRGRITNVIVHDINDADRLFERRITPPAPLQGLIRRFRAADANWFADASRSARKTIDFLEISDLYASSSAKFDGAFLITPRVVEDILRATGPLVLPNAKKTLSAENFLDAIQEEVQAGLARGAATPKAILAEAAPLFMARLVDGELSGGTLAGLLGDWVRAKDLVVYSRIPAFQAFAESYGATGTLFDPNDPSWRGEYFSLVDANVGGAKSSRFIAEKVTLESQVGDDGVVRSRVALSRRHEGEGKAWWYAAPNEGYLELILPGDARLAGAQGIWTRTVKPKVKYAVEGYETDPDVAAFERMGAEVSGTPGVTAFRASSTVVFAGWHRLASGATSTIAFDYTRRLLDPPKAGDAYEVIVDKQPGTARKYHIEINAPVGFRWRENGLPTYIYESSDIPGRLTIDLTFERAL